MKFDLLKTINKKVQNINFNIQFGDLTDIINQTNSNISDIKNMNDKQKIILMMFINRFIGLNPLPIFNNYIYLLKDVDLLMTKNIFRGFFVSLNVISQIENLSSNKKYNIIQIGTLPTFIEAFNKMLGSNSKYTFVKISTMKNKQNVQKKIYDDMCKQLCDQMTFKLTQINIENFYINNMSDNLTNFSDKYDIIIFDTYKNLHQITSDSRYLISMLNLKYIMFQLLFAINKLNSNGTLILLMHGVNTLVQQQIITLISGIFNSVKLLNSEIDYSYRFFLICTGFAFENIGELIIELTKYFNNVNSSNVLLNVISENNKILDVNFEKKINKKFNIINQLICDFDKFFINEKLIKKLYLNIFYCQLLNSYKWLYTLMPMYVNKQKYNYIFDKYNKKIIVSNNKLYVFAIFNMKYNKINVNVSDNITQININVSNDIFDQMMSFVKYMKLFKLIIYNKFSPFESFDIFNKFKYDMSLNIKNPMYKNTLLKSIVMTFKSEYFEILNLISNDKLTNNLIIEFNLLDMCPLLLSLIYILHSIYLNIEIYRIITINGVKYHMCCSNINKQIKNKMLNLTLNQTSIELSTQMIQITEDFIKQINHIFFKYMIKELILDIKLIYLKYFKFDV